MLPPSFFKTIPPILPTPPFLWEKSEPSLFQKYQKLNPPPPAPPLLFKRGEVGSNYALAFSSEESKHSLTEKLLLHSIYKKQIILAA